MHCTCDGTGLDMSCWHELLAAWPMLLPRWCHGSWLLLGPRPTADGTCEASVRLGFFLQVQGSEAVGSSPSKERKIKRNARANASLRLLFGRVWWRAPHLSAPHLSRPTPWHWLQGALSWRRLKVHNVVQVAARHNVQHPLVRDHQCTYRSQHGRLPTLLRSRAVRLWAVRTHVLRSGRSVN